MNINKEGLDLIKEREGLELQAYPDPGSELGKECTRLKYHVRDYRRVKDWDKKKGSPWTIGYGHTGPEVVPGMVITAAQADELLRKDVRQFEEGVMRLVKVPISINQFSALVSLAYNIGLDEDSDDKAEGLGDSTLLKKLNGGDYLGASGEFLKWVRAGGVVLPGLVKRRTRERDLFLKA